MSFLEDHVDTYNISKSSTSCPSLLERGKKGKGRGGQTRDLTKEFVIQDLVSYFTHKLNIFSSPFTVTITGGIACEPRLISNRHFSLS